MLGREADGDPSRARRPQESQTRTILSTEPLTALNIDHCGQDTLSQVLRRIGKYLLAAASIAIVAIVGVMAVMRRDHYAAMIGRALNDPPSIKVLRSH